MTTRLSLPVRILLLALMPGSAAVQAQTPPSWQGVWIADGLTADISGFPGPGADYALVGTAAPWNDAGKQRFQDMLMTSAAGDRKADGWGYPMMMGGSAPLQFLVTPAETLIINMYRDVRHVYTDGRDHPPEMDRWPTTWGDSVGHWDGDTLVIDTVSVRDPTAYFWYNPPFSEQAHYVERLRMIAPDRIENVITVEDPATLSEPWALTVNYVRTTGMDRLIHDGYSNDRSELDNGVFGIEPPKD